MAILDLQRNFNGNPNIVTMITDDSNADITTAGYLVEPDILASIKALNNGEFDYQDTDLWLISYATGIGFYTRNPTNNAFVALTGNAGLSTTLSSANIFVGNNLNVATGVPLSGDASINDAGALTIANGAVSVAKLAAALQPSHVTKYAAQHTTVGGAAAEAITVAGALATDLAFVQLVDGGGNSVEVVNAVVTSGTLTVTFSADPGNDAIVNYQIIRAV